ncbi:restriction endonuclease subunit S [Nostoc sp. FACHB-152]|uniref:restriction endonuclease subunit S n=1 Tax=unclassified Nostoc TaxID=2593658 RepID=UPI001684B3D9|nr:MULTISPECIES: restriction endonuclease subunit S [unclassified Nostoc]MBD2447398.1 restriction endonuclease subunit S [Nostoc sp. FACHB-152]MBD2468208.1 restriction endonuclease subunit S [Nostoc sp. FACHB-145]
MKWSLIKLGELCEVITKGTTPRTLKRGYVSSGIPFLRAENLQGDEIILDKNTLFIDQETDEVLSRSRIYPGDVLLSIAGTIGRAAIVSAKSPQMNCNQAVAIIRIARYIDKKFLLYWLKTKQAQSQIYGAQVTLTISNLSLGQIKNLQVPLPPVSEQRRIVEILEQANTLRRMRAEADAKAERILPALFIKMFGDPSTNPIGWDVVLVEKLFSRERPGTKCGPFGSALKKHEYVDNGIPVWGIDNIKPNQFVESGSLFITPTKYEELKSYSVEPGDIIISRAGTVGRMCVARPQHSHSIISTNLIRLSLDKEYIFPEYFTSLLSYFPSLVNQLRASADDGAYSFMNTTILKLLKIPLPPFALQNEYTLRMAEIRRLNAKQIESQAKLNNLFQCLLYRAFSGELTAKWREAHMKELLAEMEEQAKALNLRDNTDPQQLSLL